MNEVEEEEEEESLSCVTSGSRPTVGDDLRSSVMLRSVCSC
jgi:hypothetical protein